MQTAAVTIHSALIGSSRLSAIPPTANAAMIASTTPKIRRPVIRMSPAASALNSRKIGRSNPSYLLILIEDWPVCGRYIIREQEAADRYWRVHGLPKWTQSFNVAPTAIVPIIRRTRRGSEQPYEGASVRWGLVPFWAHGVPPKFATFNARVEGIETTPSFRDAWAHGHRCILPAAGFYEWQRRGPRKQPFFIKLADREIFG